MAFLATMPAKLRRRGAVCKFLLSGAESGHLSSSCDVAERPYPHIYIRDSHILSGYLDSSQRRYPFTDVQSISVPKGR